MCFTATSGSVRILINRKAGVWDGGFEVGACYGDELRLQGSDMFGAKCILRTVRHLYRDTTSGPHTALSSLVGSLIRR